MNRIIGQIYCGSYEPIFQKVDLKTEHNITHVLSVLKGDLPESLLKNYQVKQIKVDDLETENIMDHFKEAIDFIESALFPATEIDKVGEDSQKKGHRGAILIHCSQGVSRSVTVTMAYLLYKHKLSVNQAFLVMKKKCEQRATVKPNDGFMEQLRIYEEALKHCEFDGKYYYQLIDLTNEEEYRDWIFKTQMNDEVARAKYLEGESLYRNEKGDSNIELRCKKCRQTLASSSSFIPHQRPTEGSRHAMFLTTSANSHRIIGAEKASSVCTHFFVEPLNWMKEELQGKGELVGKLYCPNNKCGTKVGGYSWKGSRCSCGKWVVPAISLQTAKVDKAFLNANSNFEQIKRG